MGTRLLTAGVRHLSIATVMLAAAGFAFTAAPQSAGATFAQCRVESGQDVKPTQCKGTFQGGLCSGGYYEEITFSTPFSVPPKVLVTSRHISAQGGCVGGATDIIQAFATDITTTGFRLWVSGSPVGGSCGAWSGWHTRATADWTAFDASASCNAQGKNGITPLTCDGNNHGGICSKPWRTEVSFNNQFDTIPHVLVTPERVSDQGGCVGGGTDSVACRPEFIGRDGFEMVCAGSPRDSCGQFEGMWSRARGGYIALENTDLCPVTSGHDIQTEECFASKTNGLCAKAWEKKVTFDKVFTTPPSVTVAIERAGTSACAGGSMDAVTCYAKDVTTTGFTAVCAASPRDLPATTQTTYSFVPLLVEKDGGHPWFHHKKKTEVLWIPQTSTVTIPPAGCGYKAGWWGMAKFGYIAVDKLCRAEQVPNQCYGLGLKVKVDFTKTTGGLKPEVVLGNGTTIQGGQFIDLTDSTGQAIIDPVITSVGKRFILERGPGYIKFVQQGGADSKVEIGYGKITLSGTNFTRFEQLPGRDGLEESSIPAGERPFVGEGDGKFWFQNGYGGNDEIGDANGTTEIQFNFHTGSINDGVYLYYQPQQCQASSSSSSSSSSSVQSSSSVSSSSSSVSSSSSSAGIPQCSDGIDNDGDGKIDYFDANCYPNNIFDSINFNPNDNSEGGTNVQMGCVEITKIAINNQGSVITGTNFTFRLNGQNAKLSQNGTVRYDSVVPGTYTVSEDSLAGWTALTPASQVVQVQAGSACKQLVFVNKLN